MADRRYQRTAGATAFWYLTSPVARYRSIKVRQTPTLSPPVTEGGSNLRAQAGSMRELYCWAHTGCGSGICARKINSPPRRAACRYSGLPVIRWASSASKTQSRCELSLNV